jgi:hypothetical protein
MPNCQICMGVLALCFGQKERPCTYEDFWVWIIRALPGGEDVHMFGCGSCELGNLDNP